MDALKSLQKQRADLALDLDSSKDALVVEQQAYLDTIDSLKETASDCFEMTLKKIQCLNPDVPLNLAGYDYRAYIKDGVLVPFPSSPDDESLSLEEEEEQVGDEAGQGVPEVGASSEVVPSDDATPSS